MEHSFSLIAGWLIDGTGSPAKRNAQVRVENGIVASILLMDGAESGLEHGTQTDLSHCTLLPGLADCHVHLTMSGTDDQQVRRRQLCLTYEQAGPLIEERLFKHLAHGVTALRDGGDWAAHTQRFKAERLPSPHLPVHLSSAGKAWRSPGRYGKLIGRPPDDGLSLAECIAAHPEVTDHVKIVNSGLNSLSDFGRETAPQFSLEELADAVRAARKRGLKTMIHANGRNPVRQALEAGCDSIEHGFFMGAENLARMADRQTFWVPTAFTMKAFALLAPRGSVEAEVATRNLDHQLDQLRRALELGVPVAPGTDAGGLGIRHGIALAHELKLLIEAGYSVEGVIHCAAWNGARLLGLETETGLVKPGMPATFTAVPGDPASLPGSLLRVERVYVRGMRVR